MLETKKIWMNGELVDWGDATIHVGTHGLHYGSGVFEGIRAYETDRGTSVFRLTDHLERLHRSAQLLYMDLPYTVEELRAATWDVVGANELPSCYLRPIAFFGYGELGVSSVGNPVDVVIMSWPWAPYLGEEGQRDGIRAKVSSWQRVGPNVIPHVAKATGVYVNSMLAVGEANRAGYDEAILLTADGYIADGSGESIFVVSDGVIYTPDLAASILVGITRDSVIQIAQDLGHRVVEKPLIRTDLYLADEVFMVGTAAEVTPLREVDDQVIGPPGPVTQEIQQAYLDTVHGRSERWSQWLEFAPAAPSAAASGAVSRPGAAGSTAALPARSRRETGGGVGPALGAVPRRAGGRARPRGAPLGPSLARARRSTGSRSCSRSASALPTQRPSRPGTTGLHLLCVAAGIGPGDEVITSPYSFAASANCFMYEGGIPVFADIDPRTLNLDPARRRGRGHRADEGDRRGRHLRLPVRARRVARDRRPARSCADRRLLRGARRRVSRRTAGLTRHLGRLCLLPEQAGHDGRGRDGDDAFGGGVAPDPFAAQPRTARAGRLARACPAWLQLPLERHCGSARHRPTRAARRDPPAPLRGGGSLRGAARLGRRARAPLRRRCRPSALLVRLRRPLPATRWLASA